jgi:chromosome segregation ATPase
VIETLMIAALGFLVATLLALLIFPALNARAERLARRRVEAMFPLSIAELTAEKDHLRAEFAVLQRRLERKAEEALATRQADMEDLGRRAVRIEALATDLADREVRIAGLERDLAETRQRLAATEEDLGATRHSLGLTREALNAIEIAHRKTLDELGATRGDLETRTAMLAETRTALEGVRERIATRETSYADLLHRHNETLSDLDARRITISDLETRLGTQTRRGDEFERTLTSRGSELSAERQRLADLAKGLVAEQERSLALEHRAHAIMTERDILLATAEERSVALRTAQQDLEDIRQRVNLIQNGSVQAEPGGQPATGEIDRLKTVNAALEGALGTASVERARLQSQIEDLRIKADAPNDQIRAENAELRRRIDEVADEIMRAGSVAAADPPPPIGKRASQRGAKRPARA